MEKKNPTSVVSGSSFLHAGGLRFGDVLVVGLVLEFPAEVLDRFVQALLQGHLSTQRTTHKGAATEFKQQQHSSSSTPIVFLVHYEVISCVSRSLRVHRPRITRTTGSQPSSILAFRISGRLLCGSSWASGRNWI